MSLFFFRGTRFGVTMQLIITGPGRCVAHKLWSVRRYFCKKCFFCKNCFNQCSRAFLPNLRTACCQLTPLAFCFSAVFHVKKVQLDNVMRVICNLRASSITSATYCWCQEAAVSLADDRIVYFITCCGASQRTLTIFTLTYAQVHNL